MSERSNSDAGSQRGSRNAPLTSARSDVTPQPQTPVSGMLSPSSFARGTPISSRRSRTPSYRGELGDTPYNNRIHTPASGTGYSHNQAPATPNDSNSSRSVNRLTPRGELGTSTPGYAASEADSQLSWSETAVIWGTNVNTAEAVTSFREFMINYSIPEDESTAQSPAQSHYRRVIAEMADTGERSLNVDCSEMFHFSRDCARLYEQLVKFPTEIIPLMDLVVNEQYRNVANTSDLDNEGLPYERLQARLHNLRDLKRMRDLDPIDIDTLVAIKGMVIRTSSVIPDLRRAYFQCTVCQNAEEVNVDRNRINEPNICTHCQARNSYELIHNRCTFKDKQLIKIQETPESIPEGETPHTIVVYAHDDLVDTVVPGDRVMVTGIFRALAHRPNPRMRTLRSVYRNYVDAIHFQKSDSQRVSADSANENLSMRRFNDQAETEAAIMAREQRVREMSQDPALYEKLAASLAPSIWQMDDVKKGVLLQLFGGANKDMGRQGKFRGEINVLLCGDPGTSKSQLLSYVHRIAPRGIYTSGKGSSAVGLTAYVTKDPDTKEPILESGALVLSDRGICCIDEFDKMSDSTRSILHEVMEQQTVSIAKAGIICTLNARTSILASANPVESRYNPSLSVVENIRLPPTLMSRFDLIYLILDKSDKRADRRLASHIVSLYYDPEQRESFSSPFTHAQLTEYISWAKANVNPRISDEASHRLADCYVEMRQAGNLGGGKKVIAATPRQLESLIRLAEAHTRLHLRDVVTEHDVNEAVRLMNMATQRAATDPMTGTIDMDAITTGKTATERDAVSHLKDAVQDYLSTKVRGDKLSFAQVFKVLDRNTSMEIQDSDIIAALQQLGEEGFIKWQPRNKVVTVLNPVHVGAPMSME